MNPREKVSGPSNSNNL